jgi:hypothetical protein
MGISEQIQTDMVAAMRSRYQRYSRTLLFAQSCGSQ